MHKFDIGTNVGVQGWGFGSAKLKIAEHVKGPNGEPGYALDFENGNRAPGHYDERLIVG